MRKIGGRTSTTFFPIFHSTQARQRQAVSELLTNQSPLCFFTLSAKGAGQGLGEFEGDKGRTSQFKPLVPLKGKQN
ncbi:hypothetical protein BJI48_02085 [Helicobacter sp. 11S02596-1]|nr:hypothetical protein BJI48_02085 [Helicobacter sp. 11S02596-1]